MKKKSMATVEIECSNTHSIPVFSDFLSEVQKRFDIEKEAKNELYSFIIQMGLLDQFREFSQHYRNSMTCRCKVREGEEAPISAKQIRG